MDIYSISKRSSSKGKKSGNRGKRNTRRRVKRTKRMRTKRMRTKRNSKRVSRRRNVKNVKRRSRRQTNRRVNRSRTKRVNRRRRSRRVMRGGMPATYKPTRKVYRTTDQIIKKILRSKDGANSGVWEDIDATTVQELRDRGFFVGDGAIYPDESGLRGSTDFGLGMEKKVSGENPPILVRFLERYNSGSKSGCNNPRECNEILGKYLKTEIEYSRWPHILMSKLTESEREAMDQALTQATEDLVSPKITSSNGICGPLTESARQKILKEAQQYKGNSKMLRIDEKELETLINILSWNEVALASGI